MLLSDIVDYLSSGSIGTSSIFYGTMPPSPDVAVAVYETGGTASVHAFNGSAGRAKEENPRIQVVTRATADDYDTARVIAHRAFKLLDGLPSRSINGVAYKWGAAVQSPFLLGRDEQNRVMIACNYDIAKELSTTST